MPLIKNNQITEDTWLTLDDEQALPVPHQDIIVSFDRWLQERVDLINYDGRLGIRLKSDQPPSLIQGLIQHIDLVALEFPAYTDGRAYSYARLLRDRYGFVGEIRAVGDVLRDQAFYMQRCGFDSFEVADASALPGWLDSLRDFTLVYQPAADQRSFVVHQRHVTALAAE